MPTHLISADPDVVVRTFLDALATRSPETAEALLTEDVWWENVGLPVVRGRRAVMHAIRVLNRRADFAVTIHHLAVEVPRDPSDPTAPYVVLTERTDELGVGRFRSAFWVCGRLEVRDGRISGWKDYFSPVDMLGGAVRGAVGMVRPGRCDQRGRRGRAGRHDRQGRRAAR